MTQDTFDLSTYVLDSAGECFDTAKLKPLIERWKALSPEHEAQEADLCYFGCKQLNLGIRLPEDGDGEHLSGDLNLLSAPFRYYVDNSWFELNLYHLPIKPEDFYATLFSDNYKNEFYAKAKRRARRRKQQILAFWPFFRRSERRYTTLSVMTAEGKRRLCLDGARIFPIEKHNTDSDGRSEPDNRRLHESTRFKSGENSIPVERLGR